MAQIVKILRNTSIETIQILSRDIAVGESYDIPYHFWLELADSEIIVAQITAGSITVNDGSQDLAVADAVNWVTTFQPKSIGFAKRFVNTNIVIDSSEEMTISDSVTVGATGSIEVNGLLTILNF